MTASKKPSATPPLIRIRGARQHTLKNLDLELRCGELTVLTGPSGAGKSSLAFDTLYAEGQRRYVETFSAYARQFLERMDRPAVDSVDGVPPAIAISQGNPVRSSRSSVGTMTELADHFKLLFARAAHLFDADTALPVRADSAASIFEELQRRAAQAGDPRLVLTFAVALPAKATEDEVQQWLSASGFTRVQARREAADGAVLDVVADRFRIARVERARAVEAIEVALRRGGGEMAVYALADEGEPDIWRFSSALHCPDSGRSYQPPIPALFSFNSPVGACPVCRGFGRVIGVDWGLVVPDERLTLRQGALKPIQTPAWRECQRDLLRHAGSAGVDVNTPWMLLPEAQRRWVLDGDAAFTDRDWNRRWYGMRRFFQFLESKAYKMHIRVLLSRYRSYTECPECHGARLKGEALLWRVGSKADADAVLPPAQRFMPSGAAWTQAQLEALPGLNLHDVMRLPISRLRDWVQRQQATLPQDSSGDSAETAAQRLVLTEIAARLTYLDEAGLGYLTLDRQSRTLSGGEVQRINLTTALGSSLTSTLFVLDEPSTGLHPRDVARVTSAMRRLCEAGNTLVVVEHDAAVIRAADRVLDFGPGPGEAGGRIVFDGSPAQLEGAATLTGDYISGRRRVASAPPLPVDEKTLRLTLRGVRAHNLKGVDVAFPLQRLVAVAGVSGSGKSTLIGDVLAPALQRHFGEGGAAAGAHDALEGAAQLAGVVLVDQSAIGRTARSNPASYVGAWDAIRRLFAAAPLARQRGWTAGKFSFNSGDGRCPVCGGTGFEHVEMQFLSDVYLRCPECDGRRWRDEVLEVTIERAGRRLNVADVLALTVDEAVQLFAQEWEDWDMLHALQPLLDVGLGYLRLGQSVPTLSGGEAQRLKLAGHLADAARRTSAKGAKGKKKVAAQGGLLFLLDEPSCGLHPHDIAHLMGALRRLLEAGHSVIVIEHNLDVMAACDWLIELGPDGGDAGGQLVAQGAPRAVATMTTHTGAALRDYFAALDAPAPGVREARAVYKSERTTGRKSRREAAFMEKNMEVERAREHNLRALSVAIPHGGLNVVTGVSGSGKSTLAFDIIFGEGQRRYLESLGAYARAVVQPPARPDVDAVRGIAPTVAIEQRTTRGGRKSTVGTATEIWHFLRLLFVKLGVQHCIHDGAPVQPQTPAQMAARIADRYAGQRITLLAPLVVARKGIYTELAEWAKARGYEHLRVDGEMLPTDGFPKIARYKEHTIELPVASLKVGKRSEAALRQAIEAALEHGHGALHVLQDAAPRVEVFSSRRACPVCATGYAELDPRLFSYNSRHGWCPECVGTGLKLTRAQRRALDDSLPAHDEGGRERSFAEADAGELDEAPCPACGGTRLNAVARAVRLHDGFAALPLPGQAQAGDGVAIHALARLPVQDLLAWFEGLRLDGRAAAVARELLPEITGRLRFLQRVGLGYLTLERGAPTLSGGEAQRIRLAAQLGSTLQGVCYVLDEPTIGLHARDRGVLLDALHGLAQRGNTLLVVEHDMETIRSASHLIDIGPGAGVQGGRLVAQGSAADIAAAPESATGRYLLHAMQHPQHARRAVGKAPPAVPVSDGSGWLHVQGATLHNLQDVDVAIPLQRLVAVTGVSGSGKSTFAREVLLAGLQRLFGGGKKKLPGCRTISGFAQIERVLEVDQTPIGKTPRSCPATYIGFWSEVRQLFAQTQHAQERGWDAGRFSFNTGAGRCPVCEGQGMRTVEMAFLPDVKVPCEACGGQRFGSDTLAATWRGRNIGEVLQMQVDEALEFFAARPSIAHALQLLHDVGLGYLTLGQPSPTLSGGEAQRIKLVSELVKVRDDVGKRGRRVPPTLYVLDEPTVGLHMQDAEKLIAVLHRLVDVGHSVVVIEHDLDLIAEADWVIDLGPEGGAGGGRLAACGTPEAVARSGTHTGRALAAVLAPA